MRMLVTDLTRMAEGFVCVAGIELESGRRVRPVAGSRLRARLISSQGGPFDIGRVIDLGWTKPVGRRPEIEDVQFSPDAARHVATLGGDQFIAALEQAATACVDDFGPDLQPRGAGGRVVPEGKGTRSLSIARSDGTLQIGIAAFGKLRARWQSGLDLSVTDARLYHDDLLTPDEAKVNWLDQRLRQGVAYLCLGLGRPFRRSGEEIGYHWLQLNNVHLEAEPNWRLR